MTAGSTLLLDIGYSSSVEENCPVGVDSDEERERFKLISIWTSLTGQRFVDAICSHDGLLGSSFTSKQ
jgi:hypothetical protein